MKIRVHCQCALFLLLTTAGVAAGQDTREAAIAAEQAEKAKSLAPYTPTRAERIIVSLQSPPVGFYPVFGSVYSGGGLALGAGYRRFYTDSSHWDVKGLYSLKSYKSLDVTTDSWQLASGRVDVHARAGWLDATQVAFYGLGPDSLTSNATSFRMKQTAFGGDVRVRPVSKFHLGGGVAYEDFSLDEGKGLRPSIEKRFTPDSAPGLNVSPSYLHANIVGGFDWRPSAGYARSGGLYQLAYHSYADRDTTYSFDRVDAEVIQHIPLLRETWVVSLHGLVQTTMDDSDAVPYFLMPALGGSTSLRGYPSWRFRDRQSLLMSGEFRWIPNRFALDMAIFYDAGKVASRRADLDLDGLDSDIGFGLRFHGPAATPVRIEIAKSSEGLRLVFSGSAPF